MLRSVRVVVQLPVVVGRAPGGRLIAVRVAAVTSRLGVGVEMAVLGMREQVLERREGLNSGFEHCRNMTVCHGTFKVHNLGVWTGVDTFLSASLSGCTIYSGTPNVWPRLIMTRRLLVTMVGAKKTDLRTEYRGLHRVG